MDETKFKRYKDDLEFMKLDFKARIKRAIHFLPWSILTTLLFAFTFNSPIIIALMFGSLIELFALDYNYAKDWPIIEFDDYTLVLMYEVVFSSLIIITTLLVFNCCGAFLIASMSSIFPIMTAILGALVMFYTGFATIVLIFAWMYLIIEMVDPKGKHIDGVDVKDEENNKA